LQREDLNPVEVAKGIRQLMEEYGLTQEKVSERLGKSRSAIANSLRILTLYPEVLELVEKGKVSFGHAKILASITDYAAQVILAKKIAKDKLTVRDLEKEVDAILGNKKKKNYVKTTKNGFYNAYKNQKNKPNLLFEIGNHIEDGLEDIISFLNLLGGYKITLVWLVTNRKVAACSMYKRNRQLTDGIFHKSHNEMWDCENGVIQVINKKYKNIINDFYMVFNSSFDIIDGVRYERYLTLVERQHNILTLQRNNNNEYIMPTTIKLNGIDDIKIDDIIDIKKVGYINPNCRYQKPLNFKTIKNQDKQEINEEYFPKYKDCVKWAETHNGQFIKNVLV
jgi:transcriptional regulator with XRE-family HTH domain